MIVSPQRIAIFVLVWLVVVLDNVWRNRNCYINVKSVVFMGYGCLENVLVCLFDGLISVWRICETTGLPFLIKCRPDMVLLIEAAHLTFHLAVSLTKE